MAVALPTSLPGSITVWYEPLKIGLAMAGLVTLVFARRQLKAVQRAARATVLLRLTQEWSNPDLHQATKYIHELLRSWKTADPSRSKWRDFAKTWVDSHAMHGPTPPDPASQALAKEWGYIRHA